MPPENSCGQVWSLGILLSNQIKAAHCESMGISERNDSHVSPLGRIQ